MYPILECEGSYPKIPQEKKLQHEAQKSRERFPFRFIQKILNCGLMKPYPADPTTRKVVEKITLNYFLRVIPTLKHYSGIVSGIPSGSIWKKYGILILAFFLAYTLTFYLASILTYILAYVLTFLLAFYLASILTFYLASSQALILAFFLASILSFSLTCFLAYYLGSILTLYLAFSLVCSWGPAVPTEIWRSRLRSGVPTAIRNSQLRSEAARGEEQG